MIEYPSIQNSSKAPRKHMMAFRKLDGSNIRVKWTQKKGFCLHGSRTQLIDHTHADLGLAVEISRGVCDRYDEMFRKEKIFRGVNEIIVFGEFLGPDSFAGKHTNDKSEMRFTPFDVMTILKNDRRFMKPQDFIEYADKYSIPHPEVIYEGNLTDDFIRRVREEEIHPDLGEGVVCKGTEYVGNAAGHIWMCKIKTQRYLDKLKTLYGERWTEFWE